MALEELLVIGGDGRSQCSSKGKTDEKKLKKYLEGNREVHMPLQTSS